MTERQFAPGEVIYREGDKSDFAYFIKSGRVEILKNEVDGPRQVTVLGSSLCPIRCCDEKLAAQKTIVYGRELRPPLGLTLGKFGSADERLQCVPAFLVGLKLALA